MQSFKMNNVLEFMSTLLTKDTFDQFQVTEASISTFNDFHIDGHINKEFFSESSEDCPGLYSKWQALRPICYSLIKGKRTPLRFKFILLLPKDTTASVLSNYDNNAVSGIDLLWIIKFDGSMLTVVTATSTSTFLPDKSYESIWDNYFIQYLNNLSVDYTSLL